MALTKGVNSYVTVAEADDFIADRLDSDYWTNATPTRKAQALVSAARTLDDLDWTGTAISETQDMAFPRSAEYWDPRIGAFVVIGAGDIPNRLINANIELALHILANEGINTESSRVDAIAVSGINLQNIKPVSKIPAVVTNLIRPLLVNAGSNSWWRAN